MYEYLTRKKKNIETKRTDKLYCIFDYTDHGSRWQRKEAVRPGGRGGDLLRPLLRPTITKYIT